MLYHWRLWSVFRIIHRTTEPVMGHALAPGYTISQYPHPPIRRDLRPVGHYSHQDRSTQLLASCPALISSTLLLFFSYSSTVSLHQPGTCRCTPFARTCQPSNEVYTSVGSVFVTRICATIPGLPPVATEYLTIPISIH